MSRNLRRDEFDAAGAYGHSSTFGQGSSFGTTSFFKQRRFYDPDGLCDGICSTAPCVWSAALILWAVSVVTVSLSWNLDFFRPVLFSSPVFITLLFTCCTSTCRMPGEPTPRKLFVFSLLMFALYWTVYKAYPTQCRSAWGFKMVSDTSFIDDDDAINLQVLKHMQNIYASSEDDAADQSIEPLKQWVGKTVQTVRRVMPLPGGAGAAEPNKTNATAKAPERKAQPADFSDVAAAAASSGVPPPKGAPGQAAAPAAESAAEANPEAVRKVAQVLRESLPKNDLQSQEFRGQWLTPWTDGDTFENFVLRAYCDMHRADKELPHVYPLLKLGISPIELPWRVSCPYGSCILTEPRSLGAGKLVFLWMLVVPAAIHLLHARIMGQCQSWWQWLWACLLPLWFVAFSESIQDVELSELIAGFIGTIVELPQLFRGDTSEDTYAHVGYLVMFVTAVVLAYYFRDRIRAELGLHEWLPFLFTGRRASGQHTFQVCVWRVESRTHAEQDEDDEEPSAGSGGGMLTRGMQALGVPVFGGGMMRPKGYSALFGRGSAALPDTISVRLLYGGEELQRTRVQQAGGSMFSDVYVFQENFTLSLERRPGTVFTVEIQGKTAQGLDFSSVVNFTADRLERAFQRSSEAANKPGYVMDQRIADTQVVRMRSSKVDERVMNNLGFHHYPGSSGGEIWLAFCDMDEEAASNWL